MSSTSGLPNTGSTYPATNSDAITFSNNKPLGTSSDAFFSNNNNNNNDLGASSHDATTVGVQDDGTQHRGSTIPENPVNYSDSSNPLNSHHRPSLGLDGDSNVSSLQGDTRTSRNAPGKLGDRGENIVGAMGFGGSTVERPKADQGLGEKIVTFLGA
ncbi:hypothetical protein LTR92_002565 [Exophiala xenobiotica]|nr:hypothetical protein LTR92_002565 [Exophiala xenobiotica]